MPVRHKAVVMFGSANFAHACQLKYSTLFDMAQPYIRFGPPATLNLVEFS